jgi:hypothetical protein
MNNELAKNNIALNESCILAAFGVGEITSFDIKSILDNRLFSWWDMSSIISQLDNAIDLINEHAAREQSVDHDFNVMQLIIAQIRQSFSAYWILEGIKTIKSKAPKQPNTTDNRILSLVHALVNKNNTIIEQKSEINKLYSLNHKESNNSIKNLEKAAQIAKEASETRAELEATKNKLLKLESELKNLKSGNNGDFNINSLK